MTGKSGSVNQKSRRNILYRNEFPNIVNSSSFEMKVAPVTELPPVDMCCKNSNKILVFLAGGPGNWFFCGPEISGGNP